MVGVLFHSLSLLGRNDDHLAIENYSEALLVRSGARFFHKKTMDIRALGGASVDLIPYMPRHDLVWS